MSDRPFVYNERLLRECAIEAGLRQRQRRMRTTTTTTTTTRTLESDPTIINTSFSSARSSENSNERIPPQIQNQQQQPQEQQQQQNDNDSSDLVSIQSCQEFYQLYLSHYTYKLEKYETNNNWIRSQTYERNLHSFIRSTISVYEHNTKNTEQNPASFVRTLNRFSDQDDTSAEMNLLTDETNQSADSVYQHHHPHHVPLNDLYPYDNNHHQHQQQQHYYHRSLSEHVHHDNYRTQSTPTDPASSDPQLIHFESVDDILKHAEYLSIGKGSMNKLDIDPPKKHHYSTNDDEYDEPNDDDTGKHHHHHHKHKHHHHFHRHHVHNINHDTKVDSNDDTGYHPFKKSNPTKTSSSSTYYYYYDVSPDSIKLPLHDAYYPDSRMGTLTNNDDTIDTSVSDVESDPNESNVPLDNQTQGTDDQPNQQPQNQSSASHPLQYNYYFDVPQVTDDMSGTFVTITENKQYTRKKMKRNDNSNYRDSYTYKYPPKSTTTTSDSSNYPNNDKAKPENQPPPPMQVQGSVDPFAKYINWATNENPDGVPIVNSPIDQGTCGSCWAFAAAGSVEASAARREAFNAYQNFLRTSLNTTTPLLNTDGLNSINDMVLANDTINYDDIITNAIQYAQTVEQAAFKLLNLSIQELLDCDTSADQGCTGGNPLLSFYYIHRYGLTSWKKYPYIGYEDTCQQPLVNKPIATVKSWGILAPNHEDHMELAIRYIGPISVGFNGADPSFLSYGGGIYHKDGCKQNANHALLIVGYGEEQRNTTKVYEAKRGAQRKENVAKTIRYWIARNSWGTGWGENGYVRILRGDGLKGTKGVCGIAHSPSVALGGVLLKKLNDIIPPSEYIASEASNTELIDGIEFKTTKSATGDVKDAVSWIDVNATADINTTSTTPIVSSTPYSTTVSDSGNSSDSADNRIYIKDVNPDVKLLDETQSDDDEYFIYDLCSSMGYDDYLSWCNRSARWVDSHMVFSVCFAIVFFNCLVIWPLTRDCRQRRRRRLLRIQKQHNATLRNQQQRDSLGLLEQGRNDSEPALLDSLLGSDNGKPLVPSHNGKDKIMHPTETNGINHNIKNHTDSQNGSHSNELSPFLSSNQSHVKDTLYHASSATEPHYGTL